MKSSNSTFTLYISHYYHNKDINIAYEYTQAHIWITKDKSWEIMSWGGDQGFPSRYTH